jgi:hypothetical protein
VSADLATSRQRPLRLLRPRDRRLDRRARRAERRRRAQHDLATARLAELHHIRLLLEEAIVVVGSGWVQNAWFAVADDRGDQRRVTAHNLHLASDSPVSAACLVGSIVYAGGGPRAVHSQLVQRTLDLTWHALYQGEHQPVQWCPAPAVRAAHVRDLTRWNDAGERTVGQVTDLLGRAARTADAEADLVRSRMHS